MALLAVAGAWLGWSLNPETVEPVTSTAAEPAAAGDERWMDESISRDKERLAPDPTEPEPEPAPEPEPEPEPEEPQSEPDTQAAPGCESYSGNQRIACGQLADHGLGTDQMSCLVPLWDHESGWNEYAENPSSGAYGIPQALPGDKMASAGGDWRDNPATQIAWGLDYITGRYGDPCGAWGFWQANNWY